MLNDTDIDAAVAKGILTEAQAAQLRAEARQRAIDQGHEERFRFVKGFNDVFVSIGVVLFLLGAAFFMPGGVGGLLFAAALVWCLAEILVRQMRLVLPGILLAIVFVTLVFVACVPLPGDGWWATGNGHVHIPSAWSILQALQLWPHGPLFFSLQALVPAAAAAAYYWRFKLPFALVPMAVSLVIAALGVASFLLPNAPAVADTIFSLVSGLALFAAAMAFDTADRERVTRYADCAFWLHLLAAPLIVRSVMSLVDLPLDKSQMTSAQALAVTLTVGALALVAVLIDRRALLVAGLAYLGFAIGVTVGDIGRGGAFTLASTLVILGAIVLTLGAGWVPLRRLLLPLLPPAISSRLPPVPARPKQDT